MPEGDRRRSLPHPGPLDEDATAKEARIRARFDRGEPLSPDEAAFLADLPARREIPPEEIQRIAAEKGGVKPIDAATGRPHVAKPPMTGGDRETSPPHDGDPRAA